MAFDPVPWFVGGGAEHSPEVARLLAYAAVGGAEGVISPSDLRVTTLAVPGAGVRVLPGACAVLSRSVGGSQQAYLGRNVVAETVAIAATGSGGGRSDLIVARVEDPWVAGEPWQDPTDPKSGPYIHVRVIAGVPAGTTSVQQVAPTSSALALARVDIPAATGTITAAMIKDLRELPSGRSSRVQRSVASTGGPSPSGVNALTSTTVVRWPNAAAFSIRVPSWATHAILRGSVEQYVIKTGSTTGVLNMNFLGQDTIGTSFDENWTGNAARASLAMGGEVTVPEAMRGTQQTLELRGRRSQNTGFIDADLYTTSMIEVTFEERAS